MSDTIRMLGLDRPGSYEIKVPGRLDEDWSEWFEGMTVALEESGETHLTGPVVDQAALYSLLRKVRDLGMPLISVTLVSVNQIEKPDGL